MTVAETFEIMKSVFNPAAAKGLNKTYQWDISGEEAGKWAVRIVNQTCEIIPGGVEKPDITLILSDKDWLAIAKRELDPMKAFTSGKVKVTGDMMLALRIPQLFPYQG